MSRVIALIMDNFHPTNEQDNTRSAWSKSAEQASVMFTDLSRTPTLIPCVFLDNNMNRPANLSGSSEVGAGRPGQSRIIASELKASNW
jgi:hypothetical protein